MSEVQELKLRKLIGERIRRIREAAELTQPQLAEKAAVNETYIGKVERGERNFTLRSAMKIAGALGISISELFADIENDEMPASLSTIVSRLQNRSEEDRQKVLKFLDHFL
jgi:transcriptional regulator with XRE-family HTH domain